MNFALPLIVAVLLSVCAPLRAESGTFPTWFLLPNQLPLHDLTLAQRPDGLLSIYGLLGNGQVARGEFVAFRNSFGQFQLFSPAQLIQIDAENAPDGSTYLIGIGLDHRIWAHIGDESSPTAGYWFRVSSVEDPLFSEVHLTINAQQHLQLFAVGIDDKLVYSSVLRASPGIWDPIRRLPTTTIVTRDLSAFPNQMAQVRSISVPKVPPSGHPPTMILTAIGLDGQVWANAPFPGSDEYDFPVWFPLDLNVTVSFRQIASMQDGDGIDIFGVIDQSVLAERVPGSIVQYRVAFAAPGVPSKTYLGPARVNEVAAGFRSSSPGAAATPVLAAIGLDHQVWINPK